MIRPGLEALEPRVVLYSATGNAWLNPALITISFMPDGTNLGGATSNLVSSFDSKPALVGRWQDEILRAAQVWAQQTNINFVVVPDDGVASGAGDYQQGSPTHGDIRIGGYNFGNSANQVLSGAMPNPADVALHVDKYCRENPKLAFIGIVIPLIQEIREYRVPAPMQKP